jgi:hypothetical protein
MEYSPAEMLETKNVGVIRIEMWSVIYTTVHVKFPTYTTCSPLQEL